MNDRVNTRWIRSPPRIGPKTRPIGSLSALDLSISTPDVFDFLAAYPQLDLEQQLRVILVDQRQRWRRGMALPLRVYLSKCPDLESQGEMLRAMAEADRRGRRKFAEVANQTQVDDSSAQRSKALTDAAR